MRRLIGLLLLGFLAVVPGWREVPGVEPEPPAPEKGGSVEDKEDEGEETGEALKPVLVLDSGGHTAPIQKVLFTPDGKQVVTVSLDKTVRVWDGATGQTVRVLRPPIGFGEAGKLFAGALSPDGKTLAVAGWGILEGGKRTVAVYLMPLTGGKTSVLQGHTESVWALAFSPDGKRLASAGDKGGVRLWGVATGACETTLTGHEKRINALAFSPDGTRLASASADQTVRLWSLTTGKTEHVLSGHPGGVHAVAWSPDGGKVYSGGNNDGNLRVWDAATGKPDKPVNLEAELSHIRDVTVRDGKDVLVSGFRGRPPHFGTFHTDPATGEFRKGLVVRGGFPQMAIHCAVAPDGRLAATSSGEDQQVYLWNIADGKVVQRFGGQGQPVLDVGWSAEGPAVAWSVPGKAGGRKSPVRWAALRLGDLTLSTKPDPKAFGGPLSKLGTLSLNPMGRRLEIREGDKVLATVAAGPGRTLLPGDRLAVGAAIYHARTGNRLLRLKGHLAGLLALAPSADGKYLAAGSRDQTVRIWDPRRADPVLSLFALGNEWVVWTPEGYYAASPGGERLIGWHVNNGTDALASFYPAARFRASLYRPDAIGLLFTDGIDGDVKKALEAADKARGRKPTEATEVADVLPPKVSLAAPGLKDGTVHEATLEVMGTAVGQGKHPVTSLQLILDGRPYEGSKSLRVRESVKPGESVQEKWTLQLGPGEHTLRVLARSAASSGMSDNLEVTYAEPVPRPTLYVLAAGIDGYKDQNLKLSCAVRDATELEKTFRDRSKALFDVQAKVLRDREATQAGLLAGLAWLKTNMKPHDLAVIFYAGHGEKDARGSFYLLPQDVDMSRLETTGISGEVLRENLAALPGKVLLLLDACHSGAIGRVINDLARDLAGDDSGVVVMCAALGNEKAGEAEGHGYFCKALIEALGGGGPKNGRDGCVYLHHLEQYVMDRVPELSQDEQHATMAKPTMRPLPLAKP